MEERVWRRGHHEVSSLVGGFNTKANFSALRNFTFTEKAEVDKYYPQYYHKTDKVRLPFRLIF